ncbi:MAG: hypothetical protein OEZ36_11455 [Spirochaetota bacterium]|nr:hypothetical protein [Spirochaetota bacterium]
MRISANFDKDYTFAMDGFDSRLSLTKVDKKDYFGQLNQMVNNMVVEAGDIRKKYIKALSNDNKISSQERSDIIKEINEFIVAILILRESLKLSQISGTKKPAVDIFNDNSKLNIDVSSNGKFIISGKLKTSDVTANKKFMTWHDESFIKNLKDLLYKYHEAIADDILTSDEVKTLSGEINEIIYDSILMRYMVEFCLVDN